jgi:site-specific DNA-methyltransferase (adenine-specific)
MKANDGTGNIVSRDDWESPQELWNKLNEQYKFTFDCCALAHNTKCVSWSWDFIKCCYPNEDHIYWMNPPFSKSFEMFEHFFKVVSSGVAIYRCDNIETKVWQDIILKNADWIFIPKGRICYEGHEGKGSRFPSALIGVGVYPPKDIEGKILWCKL